MSIFVQEMLNSFQSKVTGHERLADGLRDALMKHMPQHRDVALVECDGLFIWPTEFGGFHLHAHHLRTLLIQDEYVGHRSNHVNAFAEAMDEVVTQYTEHKDIWNGSAVRKKIDKLSYQYNRFDWSAVGKYASEIHDKGWTEDEGYSSHINHHERSISSLSIQV